MCSLLTAARIDIIRAKYLNPPSTSITIIVIIVLSQVRLWMSNLMRKPALVIVYMVHVTLMFVNKAGLSRYIPALSAIVLYNNNIHIYSPVEQYIKSATIATILHMALLAMPLIIKY